MPRLGPVFKLLSEINQVLQRLSGSPLTYMELPLSAMSTHDCPWIAGFQSSGGGGGFARRITLAWGGNEECRSWLFSAGAYPHGRGQWRDCG